MRDLNKHRKIRPKRRLPSWLRQDIPDQEAFNIIRLISKMNVHTVCKEAKCPNLSNCFKKKELTFMILGNICTRNCRFCGVSKSHSKEVLNLDLDEPFRVAKVARDLGLEYCTITSVSRDDLEDGGASIFAETVELLRDIDKDTKVEVLIPDFKGSVSSLECVLSVIPSVVAHNIETVARLYEDLRPMADYRLSLRILHKIKELIPQMTTKSSIMLGLGETENEIINTMKDLKDSLCDILTLGQYLSPSPDHYPVKEFISPEQFENYRSYAVNLGFKKVFAGPLVRSSYLAQQLYQEVVYA